MESCPHLKTLYNYYCPQTKFAKVMFLQVSVHRGWGVHGGRGGRVCMVAGRCAVLWGGIHGCGGMHGCRGCGCRGACMVVGGGVWLWGACVVVGGHVWLQGGMHGCGGLAWLWGVHGCRGACTGVCMVVGAYMVVGGACMEYNEIWQWVGGTHPTGMHSSLKFFLPHISHFAKWTHVEM